MRFPHLGWLIVLILVGIPVFLWSHIYPPEDRFSDTYAIFTSFGQLTGIVGIILFAVSQILSARIQLYDRLFGGINRAYIAHAQIGGISFLLLLMHPLLLIAPIIPQDPRDAALFFLPSSSWTMNLGITSLLLMMALLIVTYYTNLPYHIWKKTHQFLGLAFLLGAVHGLYIESDISRTPALQGYMAVLTVVGAVSYIYRTILGKLLVKRYPYLVSEVTVKADDIIQMSFVPDHNKPLIFKAGQFVFISLRTPGKDTEAHPFSIASVPIPNGFLISVKALGDFTKGLAATPVGTKASVEGPYGTFSIEQGEKHHMIWIAGGIGITPFLSMAASMPAGFRADLYYCVSTPDEAVYLPELSALEKEVIGLHIIPWYSKTQGRLTAHGIQQSNGTFVDRSFFLCGPERFMHDLRQQLVNLGVKDSTIHSEEFAMSQS